MTTSTKSPAAIAKLMELVRQVPRAKFEVDCGWTAIEAQLETYDASYGLDLVPDFQRGHVWTKQQQELFIEAVLRGAITSAGLLIQFNCPDLAKPLDAGRMGPRMQCIDGLQRLTAVRQFVAGHITAFGHTADQLSDTLFDIRRYNLRFAHHGFPTRAQLLQYYLDINGGGTPHSPEELARVKDLLDDAGHA